MTHDQLMKLANDNLGMYTDGARTFAKAILEENTKEVYNRMESLRKELAPRIDFDAPEWLCDVYMEVLRISLLLRPKK